MVVLRGSGNLCILRSVGRARRSVASRSPYLAKVLGTDDIQAICVVRAAGSLSQPATTQAHFAASHPLQDEQMTPVATVFVTTGLCLAYWSVTWP